VVAEARKSRAITLQRQSDSRNRKVRQALILPTRIARCRVRNCSYAVALLTLVHRGPIAVMQELLALYGAAAILVLVEDG